MILRTIVVAICFAALLSCSSNYTIKKYNDVTPEWYIVDKDEWKTVYGKALGESESLEMANRKAEALAVSNIFFKLKSELDATKKVYLYDRYKKKGGTITTSQQNDFEEKITIALNNYQISKYRISNKQIYKDDKENYKVFVEVAFKKKELFKALDKIKIE